MVLFIIRIIYVAIYCAILYNTPIILGSKAVLKVSVKFCLLTLSDVKTILNILGVICPSIIPEKLNGKILAKAQLSYYIFYG